MPSLHGKIAASVRKKSKEIEQLEESLGRFEQRSVELRVQLHACRVSLMEMEELLKLAQEDREPSTRTPRAGSQMARARDVLLRERRPMHVTELLVAMGIEDTRSARTSLGGSLNGYARRGEIFKKTEANTFGLIEFGTEKEPQREDEKEPAPSAKDGAGQSSQRIH